MLLLTERTGRTSYMNGKRDIPDEYDDKFVFGIGMEDNFDENDKDVINILEKKEI